jgi:hypothetical protein
MLTHTLINTQTLNTLVESLQHAINLRSYSFTHTQSQVAIDAAQIAITNPIKPQVVCNITGGVLQGASSNYPVDIYGLDFDCNEDGYNVVEFEGGKVWLGRTIAEIEPDFVAHVVELANDAIWTSSGGEAHTSIISKRSRTILFRSMQ